MARDTRCPRKGVGPRPAQVVEMVGQPRAEALLLRCPLRREGGSAFALADRREGVREPSR